MLNKIKMVGQTIIFFVAKLIVNIIDLVSEEIKPIWIISERGVDARDNAYHLLKYMVENNLFDDKFLIYIIDKNSSDYNKVKALQQASGDGFEIVQYRSFYHYELVAMADVRISTHIMGYTPNSYLFKKLYGKFPDLVKSKRQKDVFLQHGIINTDFPELKYEYNKHLDLFVCSTNDEYKMLLNDYDWQNKYNANGRLILQQLGLCRYDRLRLFYQDNTSKLGSDNDKYILIMPTWRRWLLISSDEEFTASDYFVRYFSLLINKYVLEQAQVHNYKIKFYFHHEFQSRSTLLENAVRQFIEEQYKDRVEICYEQEYDVQDLLINASLLVTDHSSVFFDFAYMKKPVLYYHFDQEQFAKVHSDKSYFDFDKQGFGYVCTNEELNIVNKLINYISNDCQMEDKYQKRVDETFKYTDTENCKRNYEAIVKA